MNKNINVDLKKKSRKIKVNKEYIVKNGSNSIVTVLEYKKDCALLKNIRTQEYIFTKGIKLNSNNKLEWLFGIYYTELSIAARGFEMHTSEFIEDLNRLKDLLQEESHRKYVEAIISAELMDRLRIEKEKSESLDEIYDDYIDNSTIQLISEELYDLYEKKIRKVC